MEIYIEIIHYFCLFQSESKREYYVSNCCWSLAQKVSSVNACTFYDSQSERLKKMHMLKSCFDFFYCTTDKNTQIFTRSNPKLSWILYLFLLPTQLDNLNGKKFGVRSVKDPRKFVCTYRAHKTSWMWETFFNSGFPLLPYAVPFLSF